VTIGRIQLWPSDGLREIMLTAHTSAGDRARLRLALARQWLRTLGLGAVCMGLIAFAAVSIADSTELARTPAPLLAALGLWWLWLLRGAPAQVRRIRSDLRSGAVGSHLGTVALLSRRGIGILAPSSLRVIVAGETFATGGFDAAQLRSGEQVCARFGAQSRVLLSIESAATAVPAAITASAPPPEVALTDRERQLLALIAAGLSDKLIARRLDLAPTTVRTYNSTLFKKIGVADRTEAIAFARERRDLVTCKD
jgi:DNA-binding CsgD family transcriptional regulator